MLVLKATYREPSLANRATSARQWFVESLSPWNTPRHLPDLTNQAWEWNSVTSLYYLLVQRTAF